MATNPSLFKASTGLLKGDLKPAPKRLLVILAILIFNAEVVAMIVLYYLETPNYLVTLLLDAGMMLLLILPGLYLLQLRPLLTQIEKRDRVEQALRSNEELLRKVLELLPVGVWLLDKDGNIVQGNPAIQELWGGARYVGKEQYGEYKGWWADTGKWIEPDEWAASRAISRKEPSLNEEIEIESFDGTRKIILNSAVPILDEKNTVQGVIVVNQDITNRRAAEKERLQLSELLERFFASISTLIAYMDRDFNFIRVNESYALSASHPPDFFPGKNHFELYPNQENQAIFRRVVESGEPFSVLEKPFEYAEFPERGVSYWDWSVQPVKDQDNQVEGVVLSLVDVTERKRAQIELAKQNEKLQALYESESSARRMAESLRDASQSLTETLELEHVMNSLLEYIHKMAPADLAILTLLEDEYQLSVRAVRQYSGLQSCDEKIFARQIDGITDSILNRLKSTHKSMVVPNTVSRTADQQPACLERIRLWLIVPIYASQKTIGLVELGRLEAAEFTPEQIRWAETLAAQAAVAIQNAWLFEQARLSSERLQSLATRLVEVQENEREHIARELHDEAGQALASIKLGLGRLEADPNDTQDNRERLKLLKDQVDGVLEELHRIAMDLRPVALDHLGLVAALKQYIHQLECEQPAIKFKAVGLDGSRLPRDVETSIYRIVQEATTNVLRHAQASNLGILLERGDHLRVFIEDDGIGFNPDQVDLSRHLGLAGMRERAEMLGGRLIIESSPETGTSIIVEVPDVYSNNHR